MPSASPSLPGPHLRRAGDRTGAGRRERGLRAGPPIDAGVARRDVVRPRRRTRTTTQRLRLRDGASTESAVRRVLTSTGHVPNHTPRAARTGRPHSASGCISATVASMMSSSGGSSDARERHLPLRRARVAGADEHHRHRVRVDVGADPAGGLLGGEVVADRSHAAMRPEVVLGSCTRPSTSRSSVSDWAAAITGSAWSRNSSSVRPYSVRTSRGSVPGCTPPSASACSGRSPSSNTAWSRPDAVLVVVEDARLRHAGEAGDLARGQPRDPALANHLERRGEDRLATPGGRPPPTFGRVTHQGAGVLPGMFTRW